MAKGNKHVHGKDSATQISGGFMTQSPPRRAPGMIGVSKNVPAGDVGTNSGAGRKGQGK